MNKYFVMPTVFVFVGIMLCEVHTIVGYFYPETYSIKLDVWMDKDYHFPLTVSWYLYELENRIAMVVWFYAFALIAQLVSNKFFKIILVFTIYFVTQLVFWMYSRNTVFLSYKHHEILISNFIVYIFLVIALIYLYIPDDKGGKMGLIDDD